ncbi:MAG: nicotinate phosphoribosyltransferase [Proteobacteria bacterium]|nr:nicotinate phosphoribosyltransferase [Pseudomonadota bacterium]
MSAILTSLLDTDLYKFTMMQCVFHRFKTSQATYRFKCRKPVKLSALKSLIQQELKNLCQLTFQEDELNYLTTLGFFKADFIDYLRTFQLKEHYVHLSVSDDLNLTIQGPWLETILFEIPLLAIISELYYQENFPQTNFNLAKDKLADKINFLKNPAYANLRFSDFGTRRRFSKEWQQTLLTLLQKNLPEQFNGTSNVFFAKQLNLKPIGTMAHEYLQAFQVLSPKLHGFQHYALTIWLEEYGDKLGIALTDVLTMTAFLQEFDKNLATSYKGLRQDSGNPITWGEQAIKHYQSLGIDPKEKIFVFSDSLTVSKMTQIYDHFKGRCQPYFGIGTHLTNDVGFDPLDIVIKLTHTNNRPVVKISDSKGKIICEDENYLNFIKKEFHIKEH